MQNKDTDNSYHFQYSIAKKVLMLVFGFYFLIILITTLSQIYIEYNHTKIAVQSELDAFATFEKAQLQNQIQNLKLNSIDYEKEIQSLVKSLSDVPLIVGVKIHGFSLKQPLTSGYFEIDNAIYQNENNTTKPYVKTPQQWLPVTLLSSKIELDNGYLMLYSSNEVILDRVLYGYLLILINALIKTLALFIIYFIVSLEYLSKPLNNLVKAIKRVRKGELENAKIILDYQIGTELDKLGADFNDMVEELAITRHELWSTQQRLGDLFNSMPSMLVGITAEGIVTDWNQKATEFTYVSSDVAKGRYLFDVYPPFEEYQNLILKAMNDVEIQEATNVDKIVEEEKRYYDILVYPLISTEFRGAVIRVDDVTHRVQMDSLMMQSEKMSSLGSLAAGVAHEINNPLGAIIQGAQNIQRRVDPLNEANIEAAKALNLSIEAMQQYFEERKISKFLVGIREAGERAAKIVQNLLTFSRRTTEAKVLANAVDVVNKAIELARADYSLKKGTDFRQIQVNVEEQGTIPNIYMVVMEIEQVFLNILKNACQARIDIPNEPGIINIALKATDASGLEPKDPEHPDFVQISIYDNGPGMEEKIKKRIFEPFFTTKPPGIGTGLGLSVSYDIVTRSHKGEIEVISEPGKGTTFLIRLPTKKPQESELSQDFTVQNFADLKK